MGAGLTSVTVSPAWPWLLVVQHKDLQERASVVLDLMGRDEEEGLRREAALGALPVLAQVLPMQVGSQSASQAMVRTHRC